MEALMCGKNHTHTTVIEVLQCYGMVQRPKPPAPPAPDAATPKQISYIEALGGDADRARRMTKRAASQYIDDLKSGRVSPIKATEEDESALTEIDSPKTTKTDMVLGLIDHVQDGYFAVQRYEGDKVYFLRVKRPVHGKMRGALKIQSQHGPRLETRWVRWPSGHISRYHWEYDIEDVLLLLIADWKGAAMRYAEKIGKCARCNAPLTDPRSRFYGIGPECETHWGWWIEEVAEKKGGVWEVQPLEVQERYRVED